MLNNSLNTAITYDFYSALFVKEHLNRRQSVFMKDVGEPFDQ